MGRTQELREANSTEAAMLRKQATIISDQPVPCFIAIRFGSSGRLA
jgi:hypothetical protein